MEDLESRPSSTSKDAGSISAQENGLEVQVPSQDEKTLAALAHASMLLNIVSGLGGLLVAFLIWMTQRDKSRYVEDQALQSLVF